MVAQATAADRGNHRWWAGNAATVDVVVPVYNEQRALPGCVKVLTSHLADEFPFQWTITIVDNASTDGTLRVATELAEADDRLRVLHLDSKGRGHALRAAWTRSEADVVAYMDVDLSSDLKALLPLVAPLVNGHSDIAIGTRLAPCARTMRSPRRELISRCYNAMIRVSHDVRFSDAQCGFKAARTDVIRPLLEHVHDNAWFFDTEMLLVAAHNGLRVHEVAVDWVEDADSRVDVVKTAWDDIRGLIRVARGKAMGTARIDNLPVRPQPRAVHPDAVLSSRDDGLAWQVGAFAVIGLLSTLGTAVLYALFRAWLTPLLANLGALLLTTLFNTEANRRLTFASSERATGSGRVHVQGLVVFTLYYGFTSAALLALQLSTAHPSRLWEVVVLLAASAVGTAGRFVILRAWVFRKRPNRGKFRHSRSSSGETGQTRPPESGPLSSRPGRNPHDCGASVR